MASVFRDIKIIADHATHRTGIEMARETTPLWADGRSSSPAAFCRAGPSGFGGTQGGHKKEAESRHDRCRHLALWVDSESDHA